MNVQEILISMGAFVMVTLPVTTDLPACGEFNFETPRIIDGVLVTKERERVNVTFTVRDRNCSVVYSDITIFKYEKAVKLFVRQCQIHRGSIEWPANNMTCYCLETQGFCTLTFIADRRHNAKWKFSTRNRNIQDAFVTFNITYPPHVTRLKILGYDSVIPKHKFVTVFCSWENGNPPSRISLLDRYDTVLEKGDKSGNISYTFSPVDCFHAGVIRCEADRSDRNMSITMLVECPPQFERNTSSIMNVIIGQNANITFPFRSPTSYINSCHVNQMIQSRNVDTNMFQTVVMNCTKAVENASTFSQENKHCLYSVSGEPPDLRLTIRVRNLTREDSGLWHVTISNEDGSGDLYLKVIIELRDSKENQVNNQSPPEFVKNTSSIMNVTIGQNADMTFPFRSPTSYINSCHVNQMTQSRNVDTNMFQTVVMNCTKAGENASTFSQENKHCLYSVSGEPPDLRLTIRVRNLTRENSGLWHVTISNDGGSDEIYLKVIIELRDSKENQVNTDSKENQVNNQSGIIVGVLCCTLIALFITFLIVKDKVTRRRKREKTEINLQSLGNDNAEHSRRLSRVDYEIPGTLPDARDDPYILLTAIS